MEQPGAPSAELGKELEDILNTLSTLCQKALAMVRRGQAQTQELAKCLKEIRTKMGNFRGKWWILSEDKQETANRRLLETELVDLLCAVIVEGLGSHHTHSENEVSESPLGVVMHILAFTFSPMSPNKYRALWQRARDDDHLVPTLLQTLTNWHRPHVDETTTWTQNRLLTQSLDIIVNIARLDDQATRDRLCQLGTTGVMVQYLLSPEWNNMEYAAHTLKHIVTEEEAHKLTSADVCTAFCHLAEKDVTVTVAGVLTQNVVVCRVLVQDGAVSKLRKSVLQTDDTSKKRNCWQTLSALCKKQPPMEQGVKEELLDFALTECRTNTGTDRDSEWCRRYAAQTLRDIVTEKEAHKLTSADVCTAFCHLAEKDDKAALMLAGNVVVCRVLVQNGAVSELMKRVRQTDDTSNKRNYWKALSALCEKQPPMGQDVKEELVELALTECRTNTGTDWRSVWCRGYVAQTLKHIVTEEEAHKLTSADVCTAFCHLAEKDVTGPYMWNEPAAVELAGNVVVCRVLVQEGAVSMLMERVRNTNDTRKKHSYWQALSALCEKQPPTEQDEKEEFVAFALTECRTNTGTARDSRECREYAARTLRHIVTEEEASMLTSADVCIAFYHLAKKHVTAAAHLAGNVVVCRVLVQNGAVSKLMERVRKTDKKNKKSRLIQALKTLCKEGRQHLQQQQQQVRAELLDFAKTEYSKSQTNKRRRDAVRAILRVLSADLERTPRHRQLCIELGFTPQSPDTVSPQSTPSPSSGLIYPDQGSTQSWSVSVNPQAPDSRTGQVCSEPHNPFPSISSTPWFYQNGQISNGQRGQVPAAPSTQSIPLSTVTQSLAPSTQNISLSSVPQSPARSTQNISPSSLTQSHAPSTQNISPCSLTQSHAPSTQNISLSSVPAPNSQNGPALAYHHFPVPASSNTAPSLSVQSSAVSDYPVLESAQNYALNNYPVPGSSNAAPSSYVQNSTLINYPFADSPQNHAHNNYPIPGSSQNHAHNNYPVPGSSQNCVHNNYPVPGDPHAAPSPRSQSHAPSSVHSAVPAPPTPDSPLSVRLPAPPVPYDDDSPCPDTTVGEGPAVSGADSRPVTPSDGGPSSTEADHTAHCSRPVTPTAPDSGPGSTEREHIAHPVHDSSAADDSSRELQEQIRALEEKNREQQDRIREQQDRIREQQDRNTTLENKNRELEKEVRQHLVRIKNLGDRNEEIARRLEETEHRLKNTLGRLHREIIQELGEEPKTPRDNLTWSLAGENSHSDNYGTRGARANPGADGDRNSGEGQDDLHIGHAHHRGGNRVREEEVDVLHARDRATRGRGEHPGATAQDTDTEMEASTAPGNLPPDAQLPDETDFLQPDERDLHQPGARKRKKKTKSADSAKKHKDSDDNRKPTHTQDGAGPSCAEGDPDLERPLPRAGVYTQAEARKYGMVQLTSGRDVYLYKTDLDLALNNSEVCDVKGEKTIDGTRLARRLLIIFFEKEERRRGSIAEQPKEGLVRLDKTITEAIIARCQLDGKTSRGKVRDAMASSLSAERAAPGRKRRVTLRGGTRRDPRPRVAGDNDDPGIVL